MSVRQRQIPCDFTRMSNSEDKIKKQTKWKQSHRYREQTDSWQGVGVGRLGEKGEGNGKYELAVTKQSRDVKYSTGTQSVVL